MQYQGQNPCLALCKRAQSRQENLSTMGPELPPDLIKERQARLNASRDSRSRTSTIMHPDVVSSQAEQSSESEEDEEVGPMLPGDTSNPERYNRASPTVSRTTHELSREATSGRPDWMIVPPSSNDWAKNIDTTKLKSRSFATVRPGRPPPLTNTDTDSSGIATAAQPSGSQRNLAIESKRKMTVDRVDSYKERQDNEESLYDQHNKKRRMLGTDLDDDVSARPFDREKDIGSSITRKHAHQMATKSKDLNSMFETAKYL